MELRKDKDRLLLTAEKGVPMVVIDKEDYLYDSIFSDTE